MRIPFRLLALALLLAEIAAFILVGEAIGVLPTLALVLLGMAAGGMILRRQGTASLARIRAEIAAGRAPARQLLDGAVFAIAACLIILPGFLSDIAGLSLLVPAVRNALWRAVSDRVQVRGVRPASPDNPAGTVLELERDEYEAAPTRRSPWRAADGGGS